MGRWAKWGMRTFVGLGATGTAFDLTNDNVLSRSGRTLITAARIAYAYKFTTPETVEQLNNLNRHAAQLLLDTCMKNEGLYIKFGQGVSTLNHILPPEMSSTMAACLDRAPVVPIEDIERIVKEETGKSIDEIFETFDRNPVGSASIAQVHRATLRDPQTNELHEIAVKVQKPKIKSQMWWDLTTHHFVCWALEKSFDIPVLWGSETITNTMSKEVNFLIEAQNIERMTALLQHRTDIVIPKVHKHYLTERLLLTEWMEATKMSDTASITSQFHIEKVMKTIVESVGEMMFDHGFVHADPHPANVLVRPKKVSHQLHSPGHKQRVPHEVVLLDFGLCVEESERFRVDFAKMFNALYAHDFNQLEEILQSWGIRHTDLAASMIIQKPVRKHTSITSDTPLSKEEVLAMQQKMKAQSKELLRDEKLLPKELIFVGRAMNLVRGLNKSYAAPVNRINIFVDRARRALELTGAAPQRTLRQAFNMALSQLVSSMVFHAVRWYVLFLSLFVGQPQLPVSANPEDQMLEQIEGEESRRGAGGASSLIRSVEDLIDLKEQQAFEQHFHPPLNIDVND